MWLHMIADYRAKPEKQNHKEHCKGSWPSGQRDISSNTQLRFIKQFLFLPCQWESNSQSLQHLSSIIH